MFAIILVAVTSFGISTTTYGEFDTLESCQKAAAKATHRVVMSNMTVVHLYAECGLKGNTVGK